MILDAHVHVDHILRKHPERIDWLEERNIVPISWAFASEIDSVENLKAYLREKSETVHRLNAESMRCYYLIGIHPRNISSDLRPEAVSGLLTPFFDDPLCLGVGEIGLETGSDVEKEIFAAQLETGMSAADKVIGVHTPRENKRAVTEITLSILDGFPEIRDRVVVDHAAVDTVGEILGRGYQAGITLSPPKTSLSELETILENHSDEVDRIHLNTDSGTVFYEDLYTFYTSERFSPDIRKRLAYDNARRFMLRGDAV